jgi:hypothetical protein
VCGYVLIGACTCMCAVLACLEVSAWSGQACSSPHHTDPRIQPQQRDPHAHAQNATQPRTQNDDYLGLSSSSLHAALPFNVRAQLPSDDVWCMCVCVVGGMMTGPWAKSRGAASPCVWLHVCGVYQWMGMSCVGCGCRLWCVSLTSDGAALSALQDVPAQ